MSEWKIKSLKELVKIKHGYAFSGQNITPEKTDKILVTPGNFKIGGGFKSDKFKYFSSEEFPSEYEFKGNELVVTMTDLSKETDTLGYSALIPNDGKRYLHNQRVGYVQLIDNNVDEKFIYWLMRWADYQQFIANSASGTSVMHTSPSKIGDFEFNCPPLPEQQAIASVLSSLDDKIDLLHRQNKTLEAMAETLFRQWFIEEAKEDWAESTIDEVFTLKGGSTPSTKESEFWDGNINWTSPRDLSNTKSMFLFDTEKKITEQGLKKISSGLLPLNTLLMSSRAPIGYLSITKIPVAINQGYIAILENEKFNSRLMYFWCKINMDTIENAGNGSVFQEISKTSFRALKFNIPDNETLEKFNLQSNSIMSKIEINSKQIQTLENLRDTLLPKLMSGEIRIQH